MQDLDKTTNFIHHTPQTSCQMITIFDAGRAPYSIKLSDYKKPMVTFGRDPDNDIVLTSQLVSHKHGRFCSKNGHWVIEDKAAYGDSRSTNGLIYNNCNIISHNICDGDFIRIDDCVETVADGVLFVFSDEQSNNKWGTFPTEKNEITIGRAPGCDIVLPHVSVSKCHAKIIREQNEYYISDCGSTNGVIVNNSRITGKVRLHEKDVITITNSRLIFTKAMISYCCYKSGISVDASDIIIERGRGKKRSITCDHVSLGIKPGEMVAVIGGSGAGKSTILKCMCGYLKPRQGSVYINGVDLYRNFDSLKSSVGYVPQEDIVYDDLTLYEMLKYASGLRLPDDVSSDECEHAIDRAIKTVELTAKKDSLIKRLSGGERKRASIAVELLADPNLIFLDEPVSGLDPWTERSLIGSLRQMADNGKTIILVTHSTLQLKMCDKIIVMGKGGKLCFCGPYDEALNFFGVDDMIDVYSLASDEAGKWSAEFEKTRTPLGKARITHSVPARQKKNRLKQLAILSRRYMKLISNDRQRLILLMVQAPLLAVLISFVANGKQFEQYEITESLLFALSCSAFWVGMLSAIQEVCKERTILRREYMTGLSLSAYILSKITILGILCLIQSVMITGVFGALSGLPDNGIITSSFLEMLITTFITAIASAAMGLFVSSLFKNADRAMTVAPLLLMPQILFSGLIFRLEGAVEFVSWLAICRWSMEGYGTTADLNALPLRLQQEGLMIIHTPEDFFEYTVSHLQNVWCILAVYTISFLILSRAVLAKIGKEES